MDLYLIRHAEAVDLGALGIATDEERPLTANGQLHAEALGRFLEKHQVALDRVYCSPLVRARQTAEGLLKTLPPGELQVQPIYELSPKLRTRKLGRFLLKQGGERVALVGHMPSLSTFTGWLIGSKRAQIAFPKAGIAHVRCADAPGKGLGELAWLVGPDWF